MADKRIVVFIAGKIAGDENYKEKFQKAAEMLENEGFIVLNPAILPEGMTRGEYEQICMAMINVADTVLFLPDFDQSQGAMLELSYCIYADKEIGWITDENTLLIPGFISSDAKGDENVAD